MDKYNIRIKDVLHRWNKTNASSLQYTLLTRIYADTYLVFNSRNSPVLNKKHSTIILNIGTLMYLTSKKQKYEFDK